MRVEDLSSYEIIEKGRIEDIDSITYLCRHKKTGAKVALVSNDDENKVFYISFRTTPRDSTGVAHILEHSVLCGSREFPVKDPFIELCKGSLNTFLNAITYPDHTVYPVASCNDKDFQNLMHVYLDAVFYPNIYGNEAIFRQEGWHYELDEAGDLTYNGVVYNEMKGAFSSPDDVLFREILSALYPHTTYGCVSGGDPEQIPNLTYEQFLDFHRRYYHPSNSYIYLYGNMDMAEKLDFIDKHYLSAYEALSVDSHVAGEPAFSVPGRRVREYPVSEGESPEENTYLAWNLSVGDSLDRELCAAFQILDFALCSVPGAPLKQALLDKNIGKDVFSVYDGGVKQPYFSVVAKGTSPDREQEFQDTIRQVLGDIVKNGFDRKSLLAAINHYEFRHREADFGRTPKGLQYGIRVLDSWNYDDAKPFLYLEMNETYEMLRRKAEEGYFEGLVEKYLLNNPHGAMVVLLPKAGLALEQERALKEKLAERKKQMSQKELEDIRSMMDALDAFREQEDSPEDLARIPLLSRADLKREAEPFYNEERTLGGVPALYHRVHTNGIGYLRLIFKVQNIPAEVFPYVSILKNTFCNLNTEHYSYGELCNEINLSTGGIAAVQNVYQKEGKEDLLLTMEIAGKALSANLGRALELMQETILTSDFGDAKRLREILAENNSRMREHMQEAGHSVAAQRALSYGSARDAVSEQLNGIANFRLTTWLEEHFEEEAGNLTERLTTLSRMIFRPENLVVDFTGDQGAFESLEGPVAALKEKLYTCQVEQGNYVPEVSRKNEGFMTSGQVQYVCRAGNFARKGLVYTGALNVLQVMLGYEYLWVNVRVKGGAYGCMCDFYRDGNCCFVSYRDPNLGQTIEVYEKAAQFLADYQGSERTLTQYIIGTLSSMDIPLTAEAKGRRSRDAYFRGLSYEMVQKMRDQVLDITAQDIRGLADYVRAFMEDDCLCVVGNEQKIKAESYRFMKIENLF